MSNPITWRNVNNTVNGNVGSLVSGASDSFNNSMRGLQDLAKGITANRQQAYQEGVKANTNTLLDTIAKYQTPEALAGAQPDIESMMSVFGDQIDKNVVRDAVFDNQAKLQKAFVNQQQYNDAQTQLENRGAINEAFIAANNGDPEALKKLEGRNFVNPEATFSGVSAALKNTLDRKHANTLRDRQTEEYELAKATRETSRAIDQDSKVVSDFIGSDSTDTLNRVFKFLDKRNVNGLEGFKALPEDQKRALADDLLSSDISPKTPTQLSNEYKLYLREKHPNATSDQINSGMEAFNQALGNEVALHPLEEAALAKSAEVLARQAGIDPAWLNEQPIKPEQEWARIFGQYKEVWEEIGQGDTERFKDRFIEATSKGIALDPSKPKELTKLPVEMLELLVQEIEPGWLVDDLPEGERIEELLSVLPDRASELKKLRDRIQQERSGLLAKAKQNSPHHYVNNLYKAITAYGSKAK